MKKLILSTAYFPPVSYLKAMAGADRVYIEYHENYLKQTYRNRCQIPASNGILSLTVPVKEGSFHKTAVRDLQIDYSGEWVRTHLRALKAAYNSSAFYEFYIDEISTILNSGNRYLLDMNMELLLKMCEMTGVEAEITHTDQFVHSYTDMVDFRETITPGNRKKNSARDETPYFQVFSDKLGFIPDMSILDLLFNMGPESWSLLRTGTQLLLR
ncbi:MAG: WbqC family protein [Bacteroidales bacterium]